MEDWLEGSQVALILFVLRGNIFGWIRSDLLYELRLTIDEQECLCGSD